MELYGRVPSSHTHDLYFRIGMWCNILGYLIYFKTHNPISSVLGRILVPSSNRNHKETYSQFQTNISKLHHQNQGRKHPRSHSAVKLQGVTLLTIEMPPSNILSGEASRLACALKRYNCCASLKHKTWSHHPFSRLFGSSILFSYSEVLPRDWGWSWVSWWVFPLDGFILPGQITNIPKLDFRANLLQDSLIITTISGDCRLVAIICPLKHCRPGRWYMTDSDPHFLKEESQKTNRSDLWVTKMTGKKHL